MNISRFIKLSTLLLLAVQTTACVKTYDLTPDYNETSKVLKIDEIDLSPVSYHHEKVVHVGIGDAIAVTRNTFHTGDKTCSKLKTLTHNVPPEYYMPNAMYEDVMDEFSGRCRVNNLENVYFMRCQLPVKAETNGETTTSTHLSYVVTASTGMQGAGFTYKTAVMLPNNNCLKKFENHFYNSSEAKTVKRYNHQTKQWDEASIQSLK